MTHGEIRHLEYKFKSEIFAILKRNNILLPFMKFVCDPSSEYEDQNLSYDMKFNGTVELSVRIRKHQYLKYRDFTIRSKSKNGYACEIDKLMAGLGKIYFYGWMNQQETGLADWIVVDIDKIRNDLRTAGTYRDNVDNTGFMFYKMNWMKQRNAIVSEMQPELIDLSF